MKDLFELVYSGLYILLLSGFAILLVLARKEELSPYARDPPVRRPFRRAAVFLYRRARNAGHKGRKKGRDLPFPGEERVQNSLLILYPSLKAQRREVRYQIDKIERLLVLFLTGVLLAGGLHLHSLCGGILQEDGRVERAQAGGRDQSLRVTAVPSGTSTAETDPDAAGADRTASEEETPADSYGTYSVTIHARQYTRQEAEKRAERILQSFPDSLLGANESADQIRTALRMPSSEEVEPFSISWESSRYAVLDTDGSIFNSAYRDGQAETVELTATLAYAEYRFQKKMSFVVRAPVREEEEQLQGEIRQALQQAEKETATGTHYTLPAEAAGRPIAWREEKEDLSASVLLLGLVICVLAWYMMDQRIHERTRVRSRQLALDYPRLISRIVLYLGAGMSVRNVFYKCASDYQSQGGGTGRGAAAQPETDQVRSVKEPVIKKQKIRYLYEEILLVCHEMDSGIAEGDAYMHFGRRCRSRQYSKLASLLVQNLRRGNDTLLQALQEEAQSSFEERKNLARELGEEAGTKLLLPMMIMLGITMLIIIVPAYFGFSV